MAYFRIIFLSSVWTATATVDHCTTGSADAGACAQLESLEGRGVSLLQTELAVRSIDGKIRPKSSLKDPDLAQMPDYVVPPGPDGEVPVTRWSEEKNALLQQKGEEPCDKSGKKGGHCMPRCSWQCTSPVCDQTCEAECLKPECQTHCPDLGSGNLDFGLILAKAGYKFECQKPECEVQCPKSGCGGNDCPGCKTVCHKPDCEITCATPDGDAVKNGTEMCNVCETVCLQPKCKWNCKEPEKCPKPECTMHCEVPAGCSKSFSEFPTPADGMVIVDPVASGADGKDDKGDENAAGDANGAEEDVNAGANGNGNKNANEEENGKSKKSSLLQTKASLERMMTVKVRRAIQNPGSGNIRFVSEDLTLPMK